MPFKGYIDAISSSTPSAASSSFSTLPHHASLSSRSSLRRVKSSSPSPPPTSTDQSPSTHPPSHGLLSSAPRPRSDSRPLPSRSPSPPLPRSRPRSPSTHNKHSSARLSFQHALDARGFDYRNEKHNRDEIAKERRLRRFNPNPDDGVRLSQANGRLEDGMKAEHSSLAAIEPHSRKETALDQVNDMEDIEMLAERDWLSGEAIIGSCPDMCPESERLEREKKGDLDRYERLEGDRNQTNKQLAVKKYTRTAEKDAFLIRPLPVLLMTMDHLLSLLNKGYDDELLAAHNFLWDRMRAVRMDLRMQHVFNHQAIVMHEQMIRFHILAMHELCEFAKGEGFSEGFDAHLNIEQMNKASVDLFHMYDDLRKQGNPVASEAEFRGYYALLKLDKHPGYMVEPAELSLDLAKMTPGIRKSPEVQFAREVARSCRMGNYLAFFRLAREATYLQACLMHPHFSKLRTQAMASLHSGLQKNHGIPITQVEEWLAMEGEDIEALTQYHGFSLKNYEELYMVKEGPFIKRERDFRIRRAKLVELKQSNKVVNDVLSSVPKGDTWLWKQRTMSVLRRPPSFRRQTDSYSPSIPVPEEEMPDYEEEDQPPDNTQITNASPIQENWPSVDEERERPTPATNFIKCSEDAQHYDILLEMEPEWQEIQSRKRRKMKEDTGWGSGFEGGEDSYFVQADVSGEEESRRLTVSEIPVISIPPGASCEKEVQATHFKAEADRKRLQRLLRRWKLKAISKSEERRWLEEKARGALSSLVLGPPVQSYISASLMTHRGESEQQRLPMPLEASYLSSSMWEIANKRIHRLQKMWMTLDVPSIAAPIMQLHNPDARFLCWKLLFCSGLFPVSVNKDISHSSRAGKWLAAKLNFNGHRQIGESYPKSGHVDVCQELVFVPGQKHGSKVLFCYIARNVLFINNRVENIEGNQGASGILFLVLEGRPLTEECARLHALLDTIPAGSSLPLLLLYTRLPRIHVNSGDTSLTETDWLAACLRLQSVDKSKVACWIILCIVDNQTEENLLGSQEFEESRLVQENQGFDIASSKRDRGYFSDNILRDGLSWLVGRAPLQLNLRCLHIKNVIIEHLELSFSRLFSMKTSEVTPQTCTSLFNEALQKTEYDVQRAACSNPAAWPPAEVFSAHSEVLPWEELQIYLPKPGWNNPENVRPILDMLSLCQLPPFPLTNLEHAVYASNLRRQKSVLEQLLQQYINKLAGVEQMLTSQILHSLLQKGCKIGWSDFGHVIIPDWAYIFQKIYQMRLMLLDTDPPLIVCVPSNKVGKQNSEQEFSYEFPPEKSYLHPAALTLDEAIELESCRKDCKFSARKNPDDSKMYHRSPEVCTRNNDDRDVACSLGYYQFHPNGIERAFARNSLLAEKTHAFNGTYIGLEDGSSIIKSKHAPDNQELDDFASKTHIGVLSFVNSQDHKALAHLSGADMDFSTLLEFSAIPEEIELTRVVKEFCKKVDDQAAQAAMIVSDPMSMLTRSKITCKSLVNPSNSEHQKQILFREPFFGSLMMQDSRLSHMFPPPLAVGDATETLTSLLDRCMSVQKEIDRKLVDCFCDDTS